KRGEGMDEEREEVLGERVADREPDADGDERAHDPPAQLLEMRGERHPRVGLKTHEGPPAGQAWLEVGLSGAGGACGGRLAVAPDRGAGRSGSSWRSACVWNSSTISLVCRRNSAIALPSVRATSGSRFGPRTTRATTRITISSGMPMPNIPVEGRQKGIECQLSAVAARGVVCYRLAHERERRILMSASEGY